jgi:lysine-N-methylase
MEKKTAPAFIPQYAQDFMCVGSRCADTCCAGWQVSLDKTTYKRYKSLVMGGGVGEIRSKIKPVSHNERHDANYGVIVMDARGRCSFLAEDSLCKLQRAFGPSILSPTCANYPRVNKRLDGMAQRSLTPACPEAARLMFQDESAMSLSIGSVDVKDLSVDVALDPKKISSEAAQRIRFKIIDIIRDSAYPLWQRLSVVSLVCALLDELSSRDSFDLFAEKLESGFVFDSFLSVTSGYPAAPDVQAEVFGSLFGFKSINWGSLSFYQKDALKEVGDVFGAAAKAAQPSEYIAGVYRSGVQALRRFFATSDYLMTNYVNSLMMDTLFPWQPAEDSCQERMYKLVCRIGVLRFILALKAEGRGDDFCQEDFVSAVVAFTRFYEHNREYKALIDQVFVGIRNSVKASPRAVIGLMRDDFE